MTGRSSSERRISIRFYCAETLCFFLRGNTAERDAPCAEDIPGDGVLPTMQRCRERMRTCSATRQRRLHLKAEGRKRAIDETPPRAYAKGTYFSLRGGLPQ